jgi:hypothetical protein
MHGHNIINQNALRNLTFTVVGWPKWINQKLAYLHLNPVRNGLVDNAEDFLYSSARAYLGKRGFIEIEKLALENTVGFIDSKT